MLSYIGGKSRISKRLIIPKIPRDIKVYCEPFGGMFWTFFKLPLEEFKKLETVVYNDFNHLNTNIINCVVNNKDFLDVIKNIESQDSDLFYESQSMIFNEDLNLDKDIPNYDIGWRYAYVLSQVFSGTNPEKGKFIDLKGKYRSKFDSFKNKLADQKWLDHFNSINKIENLDFEKVIKKYDSKDSYFYCDPPYYTKEKYYANHEFGLETHKRLADTLKGIDGKFSLSYYDFDELSEWFPKDEFVWDSQEFHKASMAKAGKKQNKATEILIMNYEVESLD